jgi:hypothetical protein
MRVNLKIMKRISMLLVFCTSINTFAWGYEGHRIIVEVAMRFLKERDHNPEVQKRMMKLLNVGPDGKPTGAQITPQMGVSFADEMRSNPNFDMIKNLHFMNIPFDVNDVLAFEASAGKDPNGDAFTAVQAIAKSLKEKNLNAVESVPALAQLNKSIPITPALEINLIDHFYGDTSQPFHLGDATTYGGNTIAVQSFGSVTNIHAAIDGILGSVRGGKSIEEVAGDLLASLTTKDIKELRQKSFIQFINETLPLRNQLLKFDHYVTVPVKPHGPPAPVDPSQPPAPTTQQAGVIDYVYVEKNLPIIDHQLMVSGVMLGLALEQIFTPERAKGPDIFRLSDKALSCKNLF